MDEILGLSFGFYWRSSFQIQIAFYIFVSSDDFFNSHFLDPNSVEETTHECYECGVTQQCPGSTHEDAQVGEVFLKEWVGLRLDGQAPGREDRRSQAIGRRAAPEQRRKGQDGVFGVSHPWAVVAGGVTAGSPGTMNYTFPC